MVSNRFTATPRTQATQSLSSSPAREIRSTKSDGVELAESTGEHQASSTSTHTDAAGLHVSSRVTRSSTVNGPSYCWSAPPGTICIRRVYPGPIHADPRSLALANLGRHDTDSTYGTDKRSLHQPKVRTQVGRAPETCADIHLSWCRCPVSNPVRPA